MPLLSQAPDRYLRSPRLRLVPGGGVELHVLSWNGVSGPGARERHVVMPVDARTGEVAGPGRVAAEGRALLGLSRGRVPEVVTTPAAEERAEAPLRAVPGGHRAGGGVSDGGVWDGTVVAEVLRDHGVSTVVLYRHRYASPGARPDRSDEITVWRARGTAAAPAVAAAVHPVVGAGHWVAFHHDVREDDGTVDLAKWIALRFVDRDGRVWEPDAPMVDRDRDREGEEQSFEFPALLPVVGGGLWLFGRGSHAHHRQALGASGFSVRARLSDGAWGCRGRRVDVVALPDGAALCAFRERAGIALVRLGAEEVALAAGAPALRLAPVDVRPAPGARSRIGAAAVAGRSGETVSERRRGPDGRLTLFGDIHQHSAHSDGIGTADEPYLRARYVYGDDFCALSDHESFLGKRIGPGEQAYLEAVAEAHDAPGQFATLLAYEWTGRAHPGPGHKVVYAPRPGLPVLSRDVLPDGVSLLAAAREVGAFAVPHHVGWTGADEAAHDEALQPVWEICSCHGCYEHFAHELGQRGDLRDQMVDAVLARGARFGFIASSDGHGLLWHHGVARKRDPFRTGLTAVQAVACTREAILAALRERRCYATSGAKIVLDVRATAVVGDGEVPAYRDAPMGSALPAGPARVTVTVRGTAPVVALRLVGPGGATLASAALSPSALLDAEGDGKGVEDGTGGLHARLEATVDASCVYARVEQADGEMAWSSPLFFGEPCRAR
jgi:hypothetical protein